MGFPQDDFNQYKEHFLGYGEYLVSALPTEAMEQAGLLADDSAAAGAAGAPGVAGEVSQAASADADEDQEEFMAEFGRMQLKEEMAAGMFATLGFDMEALLECCAEA
jgi:hypothetical protein